MRYINRANREKTWGQQDTNERKYGVRTYNINTTLGEIKYNEINKIMKISYATRPPVCVSVCVCVSICVSVYVCVCEKKSSSKIGVFVDGQHMEEVHKCVDELI